MEIGIDMMGNSIYVLVYPYERVTHTAAFQAASAKHVPSFREFVIGFAFGVL